MASHPDPNFIDEKKKTNIGLSLDSAVKISALLKEFNKLNESEQALFEEKLFMLNPSRLDNTDHVTADFEYETEGSYIHVDKLGKFVTKYKSYYLYAGYFITHFAVLIKNSDEYNRLNMRSYLDCGNKIYALLFEIDVRQNNLYGFPEIADHGNYHYRLFHKKSKGEDFELEDEVTGLKCYPADDPSLYCVTKEYYYIIRDKIKLPKLSSENEADTISRYFTNRQK